MTTPYEARREKIAALRNTNGHADEEAFTFKRKADKLEAELDLALAESVREQFTRYVAFHSDVYDVSADTLTLWTFQLTPSLPPRPRRTWRSWLRPKRRASQR